MSHVLVVGSVAIDSVKTPHGESGRVLGGSCTYFSYAARYFATPRVVGVVGKDFPEEYVQDMEARGIELEGLERKEGKTFFWEGSYHANMNDRDTLKVDLNVLAEFNPQLSEHYRKSRYVFLANCAPELQESVINQLEKPKLIVADTMNHWIQNSRDALIKALARSDGLILNDEEAKLFANDSNLVRCSKFLLDLGLKFVIIKKGEHGAMLRMKNDFVLLPAFPADKVLDPTGAGDSFAGALMGYLAENEGELDLKTLRKAMIYGTIAASFNIEAFSLERFKEIERKHIEKRVRAFKKML